ncbi:hypothetical protein [Streptomyces sp. G1]|uniref:hypothetical protein n=1 Tax=Streptomyces sp. G1 TaxID=361572 RepID=UPI00202E2169|nr:hypothetical protein [Streptomyces sp. G1]MCM1976812.1 hypothetical protein [Streptomyces sp. G1]
MAERPIPTPADLARRRAPAPAPAAPVPPVPYTPAAWERAVLACGLDAPAKALAFALAARADSSGRIPQGLCPPPDRLREEAGLTQPQLTRAFEALHLSRLIARPARRSWGPGRGRRPIHLTVPAGATVRSEPPHSGGAS